MTDGEWKEDFSHLRDPIWIEKQIAPWREWAKIVAPRLPGGHNERNPFLVSYAQWLALMEYFEKKDEHTANKITTE